MAHTNAAGRVRRFEWNRHLLVGYTLADGARHHNEYDTLSPQGRVTVSRNLDSGAAHQFTYERHRTWMHDALGRTMGFAFDERRDIVAVRDALGHVSRTPFDANGHPEAAVDALGRETRTVFDRRGNLTLHLDAAGHATRIEYGTEGGARDRPVRVTDALGHTWTHEYDARGNRIRSTDPLGRSTATQYDARGLPVALTDAAGRIRRLQWDASAQLIAYTDCSGRTSRYAYDALGHLAESADALGHTTRYRHDAQGRLREVIEPTGATHRYEWDGEGQLLAYTDPLGGTTRYRYHGSGQPSERTDARGGVLRYHYDLGERLVALTNENGAHTRFTYDAADHLTDEIGFDGRHQRYVYNAAGELTHVIEAGGSDAGPGKVTHLERDALGRLVGKRAHGDASAEDSRATYTYDPLGRLTAATNPAAAIAWRYDPVGQILQEVQTLQPLPGQKGQPEERALSHEYDELGHRIRTTLPDGRALDWLHYGSGHLHQIGLTEAGPGTRTVITDIERDALHRETQRSQGALHSRYDYDPAGRLVRHRAAVGASSTSSSATTVRLERAYAYDALGQLVARADTPARKPGVPLRPGGPHPRRPARPGQPCTAGAVRLRPRRQPAGCHRGADAARAATTSTRLFFVRPGCGRRQPPALLPGPALRIRRAWQRRAPHARQPPGGPPRNHRVALECRPPAGGSRLPPQRRHPGHALCLRCARPASGQGRCLRHHALPVGRRPHGAQPARGQSQPVHLRAGQLRAPGHRAGHAAARRQPHLLVPVRPDRRSAGTDRCPGVHCLGCGLQGVG